MNMNFGFSNETFHFMLHNSFIAIFFIFYYSCVKHMLVLFITLDTLAAPFVMTDVGQRSRYRECCQSVVAGEIPFEVMNSQ